MIYLGNSFSIQMVEVGEGLDINISPISIEDICAITSENWKSVIGHKDTANVVSSDLGIEVEYNREFITLSEDDTLIVAQVEGGRLPEGCTELPVNYILNYYKVEVR